MIFTNELVYILLACIFLFSILNILADESVGSVFGLSVAFVLSMLAVLFSNIFIGMLAFTIMTAAVASVFIKFLFYIGGYR
jgi:predicted membrane protein